MTRPSKYTDQELASAVASATNMSDLLRTLGLVPRGGNYENVRRRIQALGMDDSHLRRHGAIRLAATDDALRTAVRASHSYHEVLQRLGYKQGGGSQADLKRRI